MWSLKILTGSMAGQVFHLTEGRHTIGRDESADLVVKSKGVSKEHARFVVLGQSLLVEDLGSRNGTFVNGRRVRNQVLKPGDKVGLFDVLLDVQISNLHTQPSNPGYNYVQGNAAVWSSPSFEQSVEVAQAPEKGLPLGEVPLQARLHEKFENLVMPFIYELARKTDFRSFIGGMVAIYIALVTTLAVLPMNQLSQKRVLNESQRRAMTLAELLADKYKRAVEANLTSSFSTQSVDREEGVELAVVVSADDGSILAPANKMGAYEKHVFVTKARRQESKFTEQFESSKIGASFPISVYKPETDSYRPIAYSVVVYNTDTLADDGGQVTSLVIKVLLIALCLGGLLFIILIRVIENPIERITAQLDSATREKRDTILNEYKAPSMDRLILNINSLLSRALHAGDSPAPGPFEDIGAELTSLVRMHLMPAIAISQEKRIVMLNQKFEDLIGMRLANLEGQSLDTLTDQALKLNLEELLQRCDGQPSLIQTNHLEIGGHEYQIEAVALTTSGTPKGYLVVLTLREGHL